MGDRQTAAPEAGADAGADFPVALSKVPVAEWAAAIFRKAKEAGLRCGFVSNGYATRRCLEYLRPWVDTSPAACQARRSSPF